MRPRAVPESSLLACKQATIGQHLAPPRSRPKPSPSLSLSMSPPRFSPSRNHPTASASQTTSQPHPSNTTRSSSLLRNQRAARSGMRPAGAAAVAERIPAVSRRRTESRKRGRSTEEHKWEGEDSERVLEQTGERGREGGGGRCTWPDLAVGAGYTDGIACRDGDARRRVHLFTPPHPHPHPCCPTVDRGRQQLPALLKHSPPVMPSEQKVSRPKIYRYLKQFFFLNQGRESSCLLTCSIQSSGKPSGSLRTHS
jgi:hypothetical protein